MFNLSKWDWYLSAKLWKIKVIPLGLTLRCRFLKICGAAQTWSPCTAWSRTRCRGRPPSSLSTSTTPTSSSCTRRWQTTTSGAICTSCCVHWTTVTAWASCTETLSRTTWWLITKTGGCDWLTGDWQSFTIQDRWVHWWGEHLVVLRFIW